VTCTRYVQIVCGNRAGAVTILLDEDGRCVCKNPEQPQLLSLSPQKHSCRCAVC